MFVGAIYRLNLENNGRVFVFSRLIWCKTISIGAGFDIIVANGGACAMDREPIGAEVEPHSRRMPGRVTQALE